MLKLTVAVGEVLHIGEDIELEVYEARAKNARMGIQAPRALQILREGVAPEEGAPRAYVVHERSELVQAIRAFYCEGCNVLIAHGERYVEVTVVASARGDVRGRRRLCVACNRRGA